MITMAKGLTSAYVQLGAVGIRQGIADFFKDKPFPGGLTYSSHPLACAAALATIACLRRRRPHRERAPHWAGVMAELLTDLAARHPSVGAVRSIGLFGIVELVRNRETREPMAPFNGTSPEMAALGTFFRAGGLFHVRPLELLLHEPAAVDHRGASFAKGFAIIDRGLAITDKATAG